MTMRVRMKRVEAEVRRQTPAPRPARLTEEDWLELFAEWGRLGDFVGEPDFPTALAFYRDALAQAKAQADPPFDPPADFMPNLADMPDARLLNWRTCASPTWTPAGGGCRKCTTGSLMVGRR